MHIDRYKNEAGEYLIGHLYYEDAEEAIFAGILGFCGCGDNEVAARHLQKVLQYINDWLLPENEHKCLPYPFDEGTMYFAFYVLDQKEFTEHGGAVPGWLTDKGRELLDDLNELYPTEKS